MPSWHGSKETSSRNAWHKSQTLSSCRPRTRTSVHLLEIHHQDRLTPCGQRRFPVRKPQAHPPVALLDQDNAHLRMRDPPNKPSPMALHLGADLLDGRSDPQRFAGEQTRKKPKPMVSQFALGSPACTPALEDHPIGRCRLRTHDYRSSPHLFCSKKQTPLLLHPLTRLVAKTPSRLAHALNLIRIYDHEQRYVSLCFSTTGTPLPNNEPQPVSYRIVKWENSPVEGPQITSFPWI